MHLTILLLVLAGFDSSRAAALTPYLVRDINTVPEPESSSPGEMTTLGGLVLFEAFEGEIGYEPWASDGTAAGTYLLADTCAGPCSGSPRSFLPTGEGRAFFVADNALWVTRGTPASTFRLTDANTHVNFSLESFYSLWAAPQRRLYFKAGGDLHGEELWTSDGTAAGTFEVADLVPGAGDSAPADPVLFQNKVFFSADAGNGRGLWASDGTAGGTRLVKGGSSGPLLSLYQLQAVGKVLVFEAWSKAGGFELWRSDGTARGTVPLPEIEPGAASASIGSFTVLGKRLLFPAGDRKRGSELWTTDGTPGGTRPLTNLPANGGLIGEGTTRFPLGAQTVFLADDGVHGAEPWVTDGTPAGTRLLADACPGSCSGVDRKLSTDAVLLGNRLFLPLADARGRELWSTDGTPAGTRLVKDLCAGACGSQPDPFAVARGRVFFTADDGRFGPEIWATNGSARGTVRLTSFANDHPDLDHPFPDYIPAAALPNVLLFSASDEEHGQELWRSDGTAAGTGLVLDLARRDLGGSFPCSLAAANGRLWFSANDGGGGGYQLWTSDGTAAGTRAASDLFPGTYGCLRFQSTVAAGGTTFLLLGYPFEPSLWVSDGTPTGTAVLTDGESLSIESGLFPVGSNVLFFVSDLDAGTVLWRSDGTAAGTVPVKDLTPDSTGTTFISEETLFNGRLFFSARIDPAGEELWTTDGTAAGTMLVTDLVPNYSSNPSGLAVFAGKLYFFADSGPGLRPQLWASDGTAAGTHLAVDLDGFHPPTPAGDRMYLFAAAPEAAAGLWVSDGMPSGTRFLKEVQPSPRAGEIPSVAVGGRLFFAGPGETSETSRLWTSDGSVEGTRPIRDRDGHEVLNPVTLRVFAGRLVFHTSRNSQDTLWQSDGTEAGTFPVLSLLSNPLVGSGRDLTVAGDRLYFSAYDPQSGTELWALTPE